MIGTGQGVIVGDFQSKDDVVGIPYLAGNRELKLFLSKEMT